MKYFKLFSFMIGSSLLLASCEKPVEEGPDDTPVEIQKIELESPGEASSFDLESVQEVDFQWTAVDGVSTYKILLSQSETMSNPREIVAVNNPMTVKSETLDSHLAAFGVGYAETAEIWWSVVVYGTQEAKTNVRKIILKRKKEVVVDNSERIADPITVKVAVVIEDLVVPGTGGKRMHEVCALGSPGGININGGGWHDPYVQMAEMKRDLEAASHGVVKYEFVDVQETDHLFTYDKIYDNAKEKVYLTLDSLLIRYQDRRVDNLTSYDYIGMMKHFGYDKMVDNGQVHEIWVYAGAASGMYESQMLGTGAFWCNSSPIGLEQGAPCHELCIVMCCNYERSTDLALHSYGHRSESIMKYVYGGWDIKNKNILSDVNNWEKFAAYHKDYAKFKDGYGHIGNIHFPVNADNDYQYDSRKYVYTYADSWYNYPDVSETSARKVNCDEWSHPGGSQWGYMIWFFDHLPHFKGLNPADGHLNNWWHYIVRYKSALQEERRLVIEDF